MQAILLIAALFFGLNAQAEPTAASRYLQFCKFDLQILNANFAVGRNAASGGNAAQAVAFFNSAYINSIYLAIDATRLELENSDTLNRGLYRNRTYQQQAVQLSAVLKVQANVLSAQLAVLIQNPFSVSTQIAANSTIVQISITLAQLEQAMLRAQQ
jgi:hypothetical protein